MNFSMNCISGDNEKLIWFKLETGKVHGACALAGWRPFPGAWSLIASADSGVGKRLSQPLMGARIFYTPDEAMFSFHENNDRRKSLLLSAKEIKIGSFEVKTGLLEYSVNYLKCHWVLLF